MPPSRKNLLLGIVLLAAIGLFYPLLHSLRGDKQSTVLDQAAIDEIVAQRQRNLERSLRLESWGECFQLAPNLIVAVASNQSDRAGRNRLRQLWRKKWHLSGSAAQLIFFVRFSAAASRSSIVDEFHSQQDLILNAGLQWQSDVAMLRSAANWFLHQCSRTPYLLFVSADSMSGNSSPLDVRLVSLHTAGDGVAAADISANGEKGTRNGSTVSQEMGFNDTVSSPPCLLMSRSQVEFLVKRVSEADGAWPELRGSLLPNFNQWVAAAQRLFCRSDNPAAE